MKITEFGQRFSVKEFADACGATRGTLYHYEKEGLITPRVDKENHYRYYSTRDYYLFQYIAHLRRIDLSIQEIKECVNNRSISQYLNALDASQQQCLDQIADLQTRYNTVLVGESTTIDSFRKPLHVPKLEYCEEEYFYSTPFNGNYSSIEALKQIQMHMKDPIVIAASKRPIIVFLLEKEQLLKGNYVQSQVMTQVESPNEIPKERLKIKPAGVYFHYCFGEDLINSDYDKRNHCFSVFKKYAKDHNFTITSDLFCYDLIGPFLTDHTDEFLIEFMVRVDS